MKKYFTLILLSLLCAAAMAQKQNNFWTMCGQSGFDFTTGVPIAIQSSMPANYQNYFYHYGDATIADAAGRLQFYTDGYTVWDATNTVMPNSGLLPAPEMEVSDAVIVQKPGPDGVYYIFTVYSYYDTASRYAGSKLYYSTINMGLNAGHGDVVAATKATLLDSNISTTIVGIHADGCAAWLVARSHTANQYKAYHITSAGIDTTPVVTNMGISNIGLYNYLIDLKASPQGDKIAATFVLKGYVYFQSSTLLELYNFDISTGTLSNLSLLDSVTNVSSITTSNGSPHITTKVCFSPDGTKLYVCTDSLYTPVFMNGGGFDQLNQVYQYNTALPTAAAISASKTFVGGASTSYTDMKRGPDGKVYMDGSVLYLNEAWGWAWGDGEGFYTIDSPDVAGAACRFNPNPVLLLSGADMCCSGKLPSDNVFYPIDTIRTLLDSCTSSDKIKLMATDTLGWGYRWENGTKTTSRTVNAAGSYVLGYRDTCAYHIDSFVIKKIDSSFLGFSLGTDTVICQPDTILLHVSVDNATYLWQDGSTDSTYMADHTGTYIVQVNQHNCVRADSINLAFHYLPFTFGQYPVLCNNDTITISSSESDPGAYYTWQDGSHDTAFTVRHPGSYWLSVQDSICAYSDTVNIHYENCNCASLFLPNAFTPNNDGKNDVFGPEPSTAYTITSFAVYNRWGEIVFYDNGTNRRWDGTYNNAPAPIGTYFYLLDGVCKEGESIEMKGDVTLIR